MFRAVGVLIMQGVQLKLK